jgi:decaprenylphospho-beta-D-erythro-pentofuranosid-2-ulose 2-reductase
VNNGLGEPQSIVLLGGTSDIGVAIVRELISPATRRIVLACRDEDAGRAVAAGLSVPAAAVEVAPFDGADIASHQATLDRLAEAGDLDVVIVAFAQLGTDGGFVDAEAAAAVAHVNFTGNVSAMVATGNVLRRQGHGAIVVLSSVAGERVRKANPVYGGSKAGVDGFAQGFGDALAADGIHVLVVRPGFVHSAMTAGRDPAPFATTPEVVAAATVKALRAKRRTVWAPGILRYVFSALRHTPGPVWRRLPLS